MSLSMSSSKLELNTLRGIACMLLVAYHIIGSNSQVGLMLSDGLLKEVNDSLIYIRMPLFTFLSGVVYAIRPFTSDAGNFLAKKIRRLIFPMLTIGTLFAAVQYIAPGSNSSITNWRLIHIMPVAHYWFVESLFLIFLCVVLCEKLKLFSTPVKYLLVLAFFSIVYLSPLYFSYFSISGAIYLMPFFLFGMGVRRFKLENHLSPETGYALGLILVLITILLYFNFIPTYSKRTLFGLTIGYLSCIALFSIKWKSNILAWIGSYSYSIYLFHVFFTAGTRVISLNVGVFNTEILFFLSMVIGLIGPIIAERLICMRRVPQIALLGRSVKAIDSKPTAVSNV